MKIVITENSTSKIVEIKSDKGNSKYEVYTTSEVLSLIKRNLKN
ncbi:hypothetical protein [Enterococcus sp. N249-2]